MWRVLTLDTILANAGLSRRARLLTEVMTLNRLVSPASEHAMPDWIRRTALADILTTDFSTLSDEALYRTLDRLHPQRAAIEQALAARERTLFRATVENESDHLGRAADRLTDGRDSPARLRRTSIMDGVWRPAYMAVRLLRGLSRVRTSARSCRLDPPAERARPLIPPASSP
jgi:hypothetical protein